MKRRDWLKTAAIGALSHSGVSAPQPSRPNIIVMLADDMGWQDLSCYGNTLVKTPNLDRLAASGIRFENFYAASAVCSPSRAAILTGKYPLRFDIRKAFIDDEAHLPVTTSLPGLLHQAGYSTAHVGKWHLGGLHQKHLRDRAHSIPGPHQHGFDYFLCQNEEQPMRGQMAKDRVLYRRGGTCLIRNDRNVPLSDRYYNMHFTDICGADAVRAIEDGHKQGRPFFLNLWWLAPHEPYEPSPEPFWSRAEASGISSDQRCFRSMVAQLDATAGQVLDTLDRLGIRDRTLIVFTSDNGGAYESNIGPYKGGKTDLHEGGLRVPGIVSWPGRIPSGKNSSMFAHHCDIFPSLCAAAGVPLPGDYHGDGLNLWDAWSAGKMPPDRGTVLWQLDLHPKIQRHYPKPKPYATEVARRGKWKLMAMDGRPVAVFDLDADPLEDVNLVEKEPETVERMAAEVRGFLVAARDRSGFGNIGPE